MSRTSITLTVVATALALTGCGSFAEGARQGASDARATPTTSAAEAIASDTPTPPVGPLATFGEGTHVVGVDIEPGTYRTVGPSRGGICYWARLKDTTGDFAAIITNGTTEGPVTVTIKQSDGAFKASGCGQWTKVS